MRGAGSTGKTSASATQASPSRVARATALGSSPGANLPPAPADHDVGPLSGCGVTGSASAASVGRGKDHSGTSSTSFARPASASAAWPVPPSTASAPHGPRSPSGLRVGGTTAAGGVIIGSPPRLKMAPSSGGGAWPTKSEGKGSGKDESRIDSAVGSGYGGGGGGAWGKEGAQDDASVAGIGVRSGRVKEWEHYGTEGAQVMSNQNEWSWGSQIEGIFVGVTELCSRTRYPNCFFPPSTCLCPFDY